MKSATKKLAGIAAALALVALALIIVFRLVYAPQLALRALQKQAQPDRLEIDRLLRLTVAGRFDLTDTLQLARILENTGRIDEALAIFKQLTARHPDAPAILLWYAERLQQYGRWDEAEAGYLKLIEMAQKNNGAAPLRKPRLWRAREQELAVAQRAANIPENLTAVSQADIYRKLAENAMSAGQAATGAPRRQWLEKSGGYFMECLKRNPENYSARGAYANMLLQIDRPDESLRNYQMLLETDPRNLGWLISAALAAGADRQFALAERYARDALREENRAEWRLELARFMSWGGKHDAALNEIDALIEEQPDAEIYRRERADLLLNAGRHREYLAATARLAAANPLDIDLRLNRIRAMIGLRLYQDAIHEAAALLAIEPNHKEAAILKAEALLWNSDYRAAQAELTLLAADRPDDRVIRKRLAQSLLWDRRQPEALAVFRRLNPAAMDDLEVAQGYAEALAETKTPGAEDAGTIQAMRRIIAGDPMSAWPVPLLAAMGRALRATGDNEAAIDLLNSATQRAAGNLKLRLELADLLQSIGRHAEADRQYRIITNQEQTNNPP